MIPLISIQDLYKIYSIGETQVYALNQINLTVDSGEFVSIVGQSGSGKSTLMNIMGCLDIPSKGSYFLEGECIENMSDQRISEIRNKKIGFIFQGFNLIPSLNAIENVELPLIYRKVTKLKRKKLAQEALIKVGLSERLYHKPSQMSGGQQQRVAIARAIAGNPQILLADEPTGNLDSRSGAEILHALYHLHKEGKTVILITHDPQIAKQTNRIIKIQDGKLIKDTSNHTIHESATTLSP